MSGFHLQTFEFSNQTIEFSVLDTEPHSLVFASIVARNTMRDPEVSSDIKRDHGPAADYQRVFEGIVRDCQHMYLFGGAPQDWFYEQARQYEREHPSESLREMISFASANRPQVSEESAGAVSASTVGVHAEKKKKQKRKQKAAHKSRMRNRR